jgi:hypothetical protein
MRIRTIKLSHFHLVFKNVRCFFQAFDHFLQPGFSIFIKLIKFVCLANAVGIANQCAIQITGITVDMVNSSKVTVYYADIKLAAGLQGFKSSRMSLTIAPTI